MTGHFKRTAAVFEKNEEFYEEQLVLPCIALPDRQRSRPTADTCSQERPTKIVTHMRRAVRDRKNDP